MAFWKRGQIAQLAKFSGIGTSTLSLYFRKKCRISRDTILKLREGLRELNLEIPLEDLIYNKESDHPAFTSGYILFKDKKEIEENELLK